MGRPCSASNAAWCSSCRRDCRLTWREPPDSSAGGGAAALGAGAGGGSREGSTASLSSSPDTSARNSVGVRPQGITFSPKLQRRPGRQSAASEVWTAAEAGPAIGRLLGSAWGSAWLLAVAASAVGELLAPLVCVLVKSQLQGRGLVAQTQRAAAIHHHPWKLGRMLGERCRVLLVRAKFWPQARQAGRASNSFQID